MSYADTLREECRQQKEEVDAIVRERARNAHKMHGIMCRDVRQAMMDEFCERVRFGNVVSPQH